MSQGPVTLFSGKKFHGASVPVAEGDTRFPAEFNDSASSIRVAPGYCAVLYEHANEYGGYGAFVDLLEDCPDLSVYGFEKKTSCVSVFRIERDRFIWVRSVMRDGQVIRGHWERKRANGANPNGTVAVVAPPVAPPTAPQPAVEGGTVIVRDHRGEDNANGGTDHTRPSSVEDQTRVRADAREPLVRSHARVLGYHWNGRGDRPTDGHRWTQGNGVEYVHTALRIASRRVLPTGRHMTHPMASRASSSNSAVRAPYT